MSLAAWATWALLAVSSLVLAEALWYGGPIIYAVPGAFLGAVQALYCILKFKLWRKGS